MARIAWRGDLKKLRARLENLPDEVVDQAADLLEELVAEGAQEMQQIIGTSDTPTGISQGRSGRIVTSSMYDDVESVVVRSRRSVRGEFGWGVDGGAVKKYYKYQDQGFQHWRSHKDVSPMHATLEAFMHFREEFFRRARAEFGRGSR